jgi:hypothetical protein
MDVVADIKAEPKLESDELWFQDAIIYQLHVKAFADSNNDGMGDFAGLTEKLDYLEDFVVNGFWTRDLPTHCRFAQDQTGVLAVFSLYYQRIDRGWPAVQSQPRAAQAAPGPGAALDRFGR